MIKPYHYDEQMNIEIADIQHWKPLEYHDAKLYCELLIIDNKNDWRLPDSDEYHKHTAIIKEIISNHPNSIHPEHLDMNCSDGLRLWPHVQSELNADFSLDSTCVTIPVRTVCNI
jgi:hypothetical protein